MENKVIDYLFVFDTYSKGWWLKIDSVEKLADYHAHTTESRFSDAISLYLREGSPEEIMSKLNLSERLQKTMDPAFKRLQMLHLQATKNNTSILDAVIGLNLEIGSHQINNINQYGAVYINRVGGTTFKLDYDRFLRRKKLVFPDFKQSDIRIKQYDKGTHYYAFIGESQVKVDGVYKWDTFSEAMEVAKTYITE